MLKSFREKHGSFYSTLWGISLGLGFVYGFIVWLQQLFTSIQDNNFVGFLFIFIAQSLILAINGFIAGVGIFVGLSLLLTIPYLIIRGLRK